MKNSENCEKQDNLCLCKGNSDGNQALGERLLSRMIGERGWICIAENCDFECEHLNELIEHGTKNGHNPKSCAVFAEVANREQILVEKKDDKESFELPSCFKEGGNFALKVKCFCGGDTLAMLLAQADKSCWKGSNPDDVISTFAQDHFNSKKKTQKQDPGKKVADIQFQCRICDQQMEEKSKTKLRSHTLGHLMAYWKCSSCDQTFQKRLELKKHVIRSHFAQQSEVLDNSGLKIPEKEYNNILQKKFYECFPNFVRSSVAQVHAPAKIPPPSVGGTLSPKGPTLTCSTCGWVLKVADLKKSLCFVLKIHCLTHMPHYWKCSECENTAYRKVAVLTHIYKGIHFQMTS